LTHFLLEHALSIETPTERSKIVKPRDAPVHAVLYFLREALDNKVVSI